MRNILVIGDLIRDVAIELRGVGMSAEGQMTYEEASYKETGGGAANVANHCRVLGAQVLLAGDWRHGTTTKTRFYCEGQKLLKVNRNVDGRSTQDHILKTLCASTYHNVIACDMGHGALSGIERTIVEHCFETGKRLMVDCQISQTRPNLTSWYGADEIFLNQKEFSSLSLSEVRGFAAWHLKKGPDGSERHSPDGILCHPGFSVHAVDTVGAGDAYLAAWAVTRDIATANRWAALSCKRIGTELPDPKELYDETAARLR